jgi:hypothetical protein
MGETGHISTRMYFNECQYSPTPNTNIDTATCGTQIRLEVHDQRDMEEQKTNYEPALAHSADKVGNNSKERERRAVMF